MTDFTRSATALIVAERANYEKIENMAREALEHPSDAYFRDEDLYKTHTLMFHTPSWDLTDEYIMGEANYRTALEILSEAFPRDVEAASVGHWTYSSFSCIKVRVLTESGRITKAFTQAAILALGLNDYPILSDEMYSELEMEVWESSIKMHLEDWERERAQEDLPELTEAQIEAFREVLHEFENYHDPGYYDDDMIEKARERGLNPIPRQSTELEIW
jgi:hypothetical protein